MDFYEPFGVKKSEEEQVQYDKLRALMGRAKAAADLRRSKGKKTH